MDAATSNEASLDRVRALEMEVEALSSAAREQERMVLEGYEKMDEMLRLVEEQRDRLEASNGDLARAQAYLDNVVDTIDEALLVLNPAGKVTLVNSKLLSLTGFEVGDVLGGDPLEFFCAKELSDLAGGEAVDSGAALARVLTKKRGEHLDGHLITRSGDRLAHLFRWSNLYTKAGKREGVVIVGADVRRLRATLNAIERANAEMRLIFATVDQGLMSIDSNGTIAAERSDRVEEWFGDVVEGSRVWEYLGAKDPTFAGMLRLGWETVCEGFMPLEVCVEQLPKRMRRGETTYDVGYNVIVDGETVTGALIVVTDVSIQLREAEERALREELADTVERITRDRQGFLEFFEETRRIMATLLRPTKGQELDKVTTCRALHTLKGTCALFGIQSVARASHAVEEKIQSFGGPLGPEERDALGAVWEVFEERVRRLSGDANALQVNRDEHAQLLALLEAGDEPAAALRLARRLALEPTTSRLQRMAKQAQALALRLEKGEIDVVVSCGEERFDAAHWSAFWASLAHVVRNAVDHGLEAPDVRKGAGKSERGQLTLRTERRANEVVIEVADDGAGIDWEKLRAIGRQRGLPHSSEQELLDLLFVGGVSTRDEATETSGRGVGMDAVKAECDALGGRIEVQSRAGEGTHWRFVFNAHHVL